MPDFRYSALDAAGNQVEGALTADSAVSARHALRSRGMALVELDEARGEDGKGENGGWTRRVSSWHLLLFTRRMAGLISAGLTVEKALYVSGSQSESARLKVTAEKIRAEVLEGNPLAGALRKRPGVFPEIFPALIAAGEKTGKLDVIFTRLASHLEKSEKLKKSVTLALIYPSVVTCVALTAAFGLAVFVIPQLAETFQRSHRPLPALTRWLLWFSASIRGGYHIILPALALLSIAVWRAFKAERWRRRFQRFMLFAPLAGRITTLSDCARFARTLATLLSSGAPLVPALKTAGGAIGNTYLREHTEALAQRVSEGESLGSAMDSGWLFPPILTSFVATGESGGKLANSLDAAADQMTMELETRIAALTALLEPALVVFMGAMVLLIALAALLPMFEMSRMAH